MMKDIELVYKGEIHRIPNRWDAMNYRQYIRLVGDFLRMAAGELSAGEQCVSIRDEFLCFEVEPISKSKRSVVFVLARA